MAMRMSSHKDDCMCPACRGARGETWATKKKFTASINKKLLEKLREWARQNKASVTGAMENAIEMFLIDQQIERVINDPPPYPVREFTDNEIKEFIEADRISPEIAAKVEQLRKNKAKL